MPVIFPDYYALAAEEAEQTRKSVAKPSSGDGDEVSLAETPSRFAYAFVEEVDALPLTSEAAAKSDLGAFPEEAAPIGYRVVFKLDCIEADNARQVAAFHDFEKLDHGNLTREAVQRRKAVLNDLLMAKFMYSVSAQIPSSHENYKAVHAALPINTWVLLRHLPPGKVDPQSLGVLLEQNAEKPIAIRCPDAVRGEGVEILLESMSGLSQEESDWLYEVVSFNHIPDIGTPEPPSGVDPPPVPIFPLDDLRRELESDPSLKEFIRYHTMTGRTEEFRFKAPGYWVHTGTNYLSRDLAQCWVDKDGRGYRLYADNVGRPTEICFVQLNESAISQELPPQAAISNPMLDPLVKAAWEDAGVKSWGQIRRFTEVEKPHFIEVSA